MGRFESVLIAVAYLSMPLRVSLFILQAVALYGGLAYHADLHWGISFFLPLLFLLFCRVQIINCALAVLAAFYGWEIPLVVAISVIFGLLAVFSIVRTFEAAAREMAI